MGGLHRKSAAGNVAGEGAVGVAVGVVGSVSGVARGGTGVGDPGVVDGEGVAGGSVGGRVTGGADGDGASDPSILRVLLPVVVELVCATGGVMVQVVVRPGAPS